MTSRLQVDDPVLPTSGCLLTSATVSWAGLSLGMIWIACTDVRSRGVWNGNAFSNGQIIDAITPRHGRHHVNNAKQHAEPIWAPEHHSAWRAIWRHS